MLGPGETSHPALPVEIPLHGNISQPVIVDHLIGWSQIRGATCEYMHLILVKFEEYEAHGNKAVIKPQVTA